MAPLFGIIGLSIWELGLVALVILLLFGKRLPSTMRSLGRGMLEFKKGVQGVEDEAEVADEESPASKQQTPNQA